MKAIGVSPYEGQRNDREEESFEGTGRHLNGSNPGMATLAIRGWEPSPLTTHYHIHTYIGSVL